MSDCCATDSVAHGHWGVGGASANVCRALLPVDGKMVDQALIRRTPSKVPDAALLFLPQLDFEPPDSRASARQSIARQLNAGRPLLYRYPPGTDGLPGKDGAFLPCSFWLVQALARTGRVAEATALFDEVLTLASPLGLLAEEMDPTRTITSATTPGAHSRSRYAGRAGNWRCDCNREAPDTVLPLKGSWRESV